jgi:hypothetical protein
VIKNKNIFNINIDENRCNSSYYITM